jgi:ABC-type multidrug transport system permease subunit
MGRRLRHDLRVIRAVAVNDARVSLTDRVTLVIGLLLPANFLILFILFALTGGLAPTAVVMDGSGPLARQFLSALEGAHSFRIHEAGAAQARSEIEAGNIVAVITVPATFDADLTAGRHVAIPVTVNNLQVDFTNDIRRAVPLAVTSFYAGAYPGQVVVTAHEVDVQAGDTDYVPYLSVSIVVAAMLLVGVLNGSTSAAREHESATIKELMLSPASRWALAAGKVAGPLVMMAPGVALALGAVVLGLGVWPVHPLEALLLTLLLMVSFASIGGLVGALVRRRQAAIPLSIASSLPLFFLSGAFGPPNWQGSVVGAAALASPLTYGIEAFQHAFHGYRTAQPSLGTDVAVLLGFAVAAVLLFALAIRRTAPGH